MFSFIWRHKWKITAVGAIVGVAAYARHKISDIDFEGQLQARLEDELAREMRALREEEHVKSINVEGRDRAAEFIPLIKQLCSEQLPVADAVHKLKSGTGDWGEVIRLAFTRVAVSAATIATLTCLTRVNIAVLSRVHASSPEKITTELRAHVFEVVVGHLAKSG